MPRSAVLRVDVDTIATSIPYLQKPLHLQGGSQHILRPLGAACPRRRAFQVSRWRRRRAGCRRARFPTNQLSSPFSLPVSAVPVLPATSIRRGGRRRVPVPSVNDALEHDLGHAAGRSPCAIGLRGTRSDDGGEAAARRWRCRRRRRGRAFMDGAVVGDGACARGPSAGRWPGGRRGLCGAASAAGARARPSAAQAGLPLRTSRRGRP